MCYFYLLLLLFFIFYSGLFIYNTNHQLNYAVVIVKAIRLLKHSGMVMEANSIFQGVVHPSRIGAKWKIGKVAAPAEYPFIIVQQPPLRSPETLRREREGKQIFPCLNDLS